MGGWCKCMIGWFFGVIYMNCMLFCWNFVKSSELVMEFAMIFAHSESVFVQILCVNLKSIHFIYEYILNPSNGPTFFFFKKKIGG